MIAAVRYIRSAASRQSPGFKTRTRSISVIRLIKRYGSRKLYDTEESRYVSLEEIGGWVRRGQQVKVVDNTSGDEVTAQTLALVIVEEGRRGSSFFTSDLLHDLIRRGEHVFSTSVEQLQHGVDRALRASLDRIPPLRQVREETAQLRQRLEALEASLAEIEADDVTGFRPTDRTRFEPANTGIRTARRKGVHS
jgi:polyhydroxyalkanoate synthesis repressor PhaR